MSETTALAPGLTHEKTIVVTEEMTPRHLRGDRIRVLATPEMVRLIEQTAIDAVTPYLQHGQQTVGTKIDVAHLAATPEGMRVTIRVTLIGIDRRRLSFRAEIHDEVEKVGEATHERFILDQDKRTDRLAEKVAQWKGR